MTCTLAIKLKRIGITDPKATVLHCAVGGMVHFPVPVVSGPLDPRSTGARVKKYQRRNFTSEKERQDYYNQIRKLRRVLGVEEPVSA